MYFFALEQLCKMVINWIDMDLLILLLINLLWLLQLQQGKPGNFAKETHVSLTSKQKERLDLQEIFPSLKEFRADRHRIHFGPPLQQKCFMQTRYEGIEHSHVVKHLSNP